MLSVLLLAVLPCLLGACGRAPEASGLVAEKADEANGRERPVGMKARVADAGPGGAARSKAVFVSADPDADASSLVRGRRLQAKAEGRLLVVYVGATWCEPCKRFKAEVESGRLDARLGSITFLAFDADKDAERLEAAGYTFSFVPFVALPSAGGRPSDSVAATGKGSDAWRDLVAALEAWQRRR